jgi:predicted permease
MMDSVRELAGRIRSFFRKGKLDGDLNEEMIAHLEMAIEENKRSGMSEEEALRQAMIRFGGIAMAQEVHREARGLPWLDTVQQDVRYALRTLRRDAGFTTIAVLILALGIGANTAVFSVMDTVLLRPLPFRDASQLVWVEDQQGHEGLSSATFPVAVFEALRARNHSFQDMTAYFAFFGFGDYKLTGRGEPARLVGLPVAQNFFPMLGVQPILGRQFTDEECRKNGSRAVLLGHALWQQRFGGDPRMVGQSLTLDGNTFTVVGVLPASWDFGSVFAPGTRVDFYVPCVMDDIRTYGNTLAIVGRLKPGLTVADARTEFAALQPALKKAHPEWYSEFRARLDGLKDYVSGKLRRSLIVVWCAIGMILLIVCVNLANLLLARSATRGKEFALRSALGAGRGRMIRQLLTESLVLASGGAVLGLGFAFALTRYLASSGTIALPLLQNVRVDGTALAFTMLVTLGAAVLFGLAPGLKAAGGKMQMALQESSRGSSEGRGHANFRALLVVSEVALACVLLVGAGLLLRSFVHLLDVDLGFQPTRAIDLRVSFQGPPSGLQELLHRVQALPGIDAVGIADALPLAQNRAWGLAAKGKNYPAVAYPSAFVYVITPGYLDAMGMRLRSGRDFTWADAEKSEKVILINESAARHIWPGLDPIGRIANAGGADSRIVGVVADVRESSVEQEPGNEMFLPATQALGGSSDLDLVMRTRLPAESIAPSVRTTLRSINPNQTVTDFKPLQQLVDRSISPRRFFVLMVTAFATLGLLLASLGIYGVISYSVARQTRDIGIRMALGASPGELQMSVIGRTLRLALTGVAVGTVASVVVARLIGSLLFGISPSDPVTFAGTVLLLSVVALSAGYVPARRASRVDPAVALRSE